VAAEAGRIIAVKTKNRRTMRLVINTLWNKDIIALFLWLGGQVGNLPHFVAS
jgi:hypothetical protein